MPRSSGGSFEFSSSRQGLSLRRLSLQVARLRRRAAGSPWLALVGGAGLVVVTVPGFAVDLARYGRQEPLMVGLMCGGGAVLAASIDRACADRSATLDLLSSEGWGPLRSARESPRKRPPSAFLRWFRSSGWRRATSDAPSPTSTTDATDCLDHSRGRRTPLVAMTARTIQLTLAPSRFYDATPGEELIAKTQGLLNRMDTVLGSHAPGILLAAAVVLLIVLTARRRVEVVAAGYLVTGVGFLVFAGQVNVAPSRYYLPTATLGALAVVRLTARLENLRVGALVAAALLVLAGAQVRDAHALVADWVRVNDSRSGSFGSSAGSAPQDAMFASPAGR